MSFKNEASRIWNSTPTPLYSEFMSKRKATSSGPYDKELPNDEKLFWSYVQKLKDKYPTCKVDVDPRGPYGARSGNTFQRFEASGGQNYYTQFERAEKACQLQQIHRRMIKNTSSMASKRMRRERLREVPKKEMPIETRQNLEAYLKEKNNARKKQENNLRKEEEQKRIEREAEEKKRFASVKQGNLLGLTKTNNNLLSFEPSKAMMNERAAELSVLNFSPPNVTHKNFTNAGIEIEEETISHLSKNQRKELLSQLKSMNKSEQNSAINTYLATHVLGKGGKRKTRKARKQRKTRKH